ncbi:hypothetical protein Hdeb2414_s0001g00017551 [Helianthus debilis subsp. tardiflorus]
MKMVFRGKEDVPIETIQPPFSEAWYQDIMDVPSIALPEKALVGATMSLFLRMNREDKPVYMEGDSSKILDLFSSPSFFLIFPFSPFALVSLYVFGFEREGLRMATVPKRADRGALGFASVVVKKPKAEPRDTADIPPSNPDDPIDLESSPEPLLKKKAGKRKHTDTEADGKPAKKVQRKKITRRGNLDAFITKPTLENPSSPHAPISRQLENTKIVGEDEAERTTEIGNLEVEKPVEVAVESENSVSPGAAGVDVGHPKSPKFVARDPEKEKSAQEDFVATFPTVGSTPVNVEKVSEDPSSFTYVDENSPIRLDETLGDYYYGTYLEKNASEIHAPVWNLKKGDTFSDWLVCQDWLQGAFLPGEIKFQEECPHE